MEQGRTVSDHAMDGQIAYTCFAEVILVLFASFPGIWNIFQLLGNSGSEVSKSVYNAVYCMENFILGNQDKTLVQKYFSEIMKHIGPNRITRCRFSFSPGQNLNEPGLAKPD